MQHSIELRILNDRGAVAWWRTCTLPWSEVQLIEKGVLAVGKEIRSGKAEAGPAVSNPAIFWLRSGELLTTDLPYAGAVLALNHYLAAKE
jgi:hypothetical protein